MKQPKVALIHDYLIQFGGAEKTLEAIAELYPDADIYTGIYKPEKMSDYLKSRHIKHKTNFLLANLSKYFTFLMPVLFESFNIKEYDLIISDGTSWSKGVLTRPEQLHISYVHTPARFLYGYTVESTQRNAWYFKPFIMAIDAYLRIWDYVSAQRPDFLLANSLEVQKRIKKYFKRSSVVIYPPVDLNRNNHYEKDIFKKPYYLIISRLVAYKNIDLAIKAFGMTNFDLVIVGDGKEKGRLKKLAGKNVTLLGWVSEKEKHGLLENCLGVINPVQDEDLGIVPIEAMAHGKPVLAHRSGGHLETIEENKTGMFFDELTEEHFVAKIKEFDEKIRSKGFEPELGIQKAQKFSKERFQSEFKNFVAEKWELHQQENA